MPTVHHTPTRTYLLHYNNKNMVCFFDDACYQFFLLRLLNSLRQYHVELHAYCLLAEDVYLLMTPGTPYGIDNLWKATVRQYNSYFGLRFHRSVRIIGSAYESIEASEDKTALAMQKQIERMPLDKLHAEHPGIHPWSSYCDNGFGNSNSWLTPHWEYLRFLQESKQGFEKYRASIAAAPQATSIAASYDKSVKTPALGR